MSSESMPLTVTLARSRCPVGPASDGHFELYKTRKHFDARSGASSSDGGFEPAAPLTGLHVDRRGPRNPASLGAIRPRLPAARNRLCRLLLHSAAGSLGNRSCFEAAPQREKESMRTMNSAFLIVGVLTAASVWSCADNNPPAQSPTMTTSGSPGPTDPSVPPQTSGGYAVPSSATMGGASTSGTSGTSGSQGTGATTSAPSPSATSTTSSAPKNSPSSYPH
jgi:hypothetical protein